MNEKDYDKELQIKTTGIREWLTSSVHHNRYEATPYFALDGLFSEYELQKSDVVVDFGCGKGRLPFYIHNRLKTAVVGGEVSDILIAKSSIRFECVLAEQYEIRPEDNKFYFFNPFSVVIFGKVLNNILLSVEKEKRVVDVILY